MPSSEILPQPNPNQHDSNRGSQPDRHTSRLALARRLRARGALPTDGRGPAGCRCLVSPRAVANCIARHANNKTGLSWPGMGTIATETGFKRSAVILGIKELERGGHVPVFRFKVGKKNKSNRYQLPPMGGSPGGLVEGGGSSLDGLPSSLDGLGGSSLDEPESVSIESVHESVSSSRAREVCKICGHNWPAEYGTVCHKCPQPTPSELREQRNEEASNEFERKLREKTPTGCTCGDAYRQSYERRCIDCEGEPSVAQRDALREKHGGGAEHDGGGVDGGGADNPSAVAEPKPDIARLKRCWKEARAQLNRKHHTGETHDRETKSSDRQPVCKAHG